jgi:hypothetical protein
MSDATETKVSEKEPKATIKSLAIKEFGAVDEADLVSQLLGKGLSAEEKAVRKSINAFETVISVVGTLSVEQAQKLKELQDDLTLLQMSEAEKAAKRAEKCFAVFLTWAKNTPTGKQLA